VCAWLWARRRARCTEIDTAAGNASGSNRSNNGLIASIALTKLISGLLFGVRTTDLATLIAVTLLLVVVALIANYIPARAR
jgi:hypothetical protein